MNPATAELVMVTAKRGERESVSVSAVCWRSASATKKKIDKTETTTRNFASLPFRSFGAAVMPLALATIADGLIRRNKRSVEGLGWAREEY